MTTTIQFSFWKAKYCIIADRILKAMEEFNIYDYISTEKLILDYFGFYPIDNYGKNNFKLLKRVCIFGVFISYTAQIISTPFYMDFNEIIEPFMIALTEFAFLGKLVVFIKNEKKTNKLFDELKNISSYSRAPIRNMRYLQKELKHTRWFSNVYRAVIVCYVCYVSFLKPLVKSSDNRQLPLGGHIPCDIERNSCFITFSIYQSLIGCISALTNINIECLFCKLTTTCCYGFDILSNNLQNIDYRYEEVAKIELNHNVIFHQKLLRYAVQIDEIFNKVAFFQCLASMLVIGITLFQMLLVPLISLEFLGLLNYFMCILIQIALFCWYGNTIKLKTEQIRTACYMSNWCEGGIKLRKTLFIIMERTKRPFVMKAGGFFTLSLSTFTMILKTSYSLLSAIRNE